MAPTNDMSAVLYGLDGANARVGALGRWLEPDDLIDTAPGTPIGSLAFPRDWPSVFKTNATLKQLVNDEGDTVLEVREHRVLWRGHRITSVTLVHNCSQRLRDRITKAIGMVAATGSARPERESPPF